MKQNNFTKKRMIHICIVAFMIILLIIVAGLLMLKYSVEGETNLPFSLKKINIISTAQSDISRDEEENWHAGILQTNDIFLVIEKNTNYKKEDTIKEIKIENITFSKQNDKSRIKIYRPKSNLFNYSYIDDYKLGTEIKLEGALETNLEVLQLNNQGATIGFSITQDNLGEYAFSVNEKVPSDGKLLAKAGLKKEDIHFVMTFDLIIETGSGNKFKTTISLQLPTGDILTEGVCTYEDTELKDIIYKRIK